MAVIYTHFCTVASLLLNNSMAFAIMTTGYAICSLPLPSMAGDRALNLLTQIEVEPVQSFTAQAEKVCFGQKGDQLVRLSIRWCLV